MDFGSGRGKGEDDGVDDDDVEEEEEEEDDDDDDDEEKAMSNLKSVARDVSKRKRGKE